MSTKAKGKARKVSNKRFSLDHLTDTEFEEFCFELLQELGFVNVKWRKGTGLSTSPSDRGRDIECELEREDIDGHKSFEKWFVECKHSVKGVSPDKIQGALSWAAAERPDKLLIIASNFLSNPAHDFISAYEAANKPYFRIKKWERPDLEKLASTKSKLLRKYKVTSDFAFVAILHPAHLLYLKSLQLNSLDHFFTALDKLDPDKRDKILSLVYEIVIRPRYREATTGNESRNDLRIDEVSYTVFKTKARVLADVLGDPFLVTGLVSWILQGLLEWGNTTAIDEKIEALTSRIRFIQGVIKAYEGDPEGDAIGLQSYMEVSKQYPKLSEEDLPSRLTDMVNFMQNNLKKIPGNTKETYSLYEYFCKNVVSELLIEEVIYEHKL